MLFRVQVKHHHWRKCVFCRLIEFFFWGQSVTPFLSLGTEAFWLGHQRKSGLAFAARYNTDKMVIWDITFMVQLSSTDLSYDEYRTCICYTENSLLSG